MKAKTYIGPLFAIIAIISALAVVAVSWLPRKDRVAGHDIVDAAARLAETATLSKLLKESGLNLQLNRLGPYTAFYPTDAAFKKLPPGILDRLRRPHNLPLLRLFLRHHVVGGRHKLDAIARMATLTSLGGQTLEVTTPDGTVMIENARIIRSDIECANGMVHVIDSVIQIRIIP